MKQVGLIILSIFSFLFCGHAQHYAFQAGERIEYSVAYSVAGLYVNAGSASFSTVKTLDANAEIYHLIGEGATNSTYDWIFKVRDRYESYFDVNAMQPVKFVRNVNEGKYKKHEEVVFNLKNNTAISKNGVHKVPHDVQDVISSVYCARSVDYSKYKPGDKIPFNMFFGSDMYTMYIRYAGKELVKTKYGKINTIKLKPLLLKGNTFKGGEGMTVWVTDDNNHVPVKIESKLSVGSIKVYLTSHQNLKYPLMIAEK